MAQGDYEYPVRESEWKMAMRGGQGEGESLTWPCKKWTLEKGTGSVGCHGSQRPHPPCPGMIPIS
jgi:hypothetical protein